MITPVRSGIGVLVLVVVAAVAGTGVLLRARIGSRAKEGASRVAAAAESSDAAEPSPSMAPLATVAPSAVATEASSPVGGASPSSTVELPPLPEHARIDPRSDAACPQGMLLVDGAYCPAVAHFCAEWVGEDPTASPVRRGPKRCRRYQKKLVCEGQMARLHVCIDRFEYPNLVGARPALMTTYRDASHACSVEGKRLCEADEWTLACEGPRTWPYPHGLEREPARCPIDRPRRAPNHEALARPNDVSLEVERLDQRAPSGAHPGCASTFGVHDLIGNVSEWVHDRRGQRGAPRSDIALAGGGWEPAVATCRNVDSRATPDEATYQSGFRCCANALDGEAPRRALGDSARYPH